MCLDTITWQAKSNSNTKSKDKWSKGYKVFVVNKEKIFSPFYNLEGKECKYYNKQELNIGTLYKNKIKSVITTTSTDNYKPYTSGFHIFPVAMAAKLFVQKYTEDRMLFEVQYRKVSVIGTHAVHTDYPVDCVIAQEMKIIRPLTIDEIEELLKNEERIDRND